MVNWNTLVYYSIIVSSIPFFKASSIILPRNLGNLKILKLDNYEMPSDFLEQDYKANDSDEGEYNLSDWNSDEDLVGNKSQWNLKRQSGDCNSWRHA